MESITESLLFLTIIGFCWASSPLPPHIVFILADDLGWNDVGYHGSVIKTPAIDNLAREGVRLENYYVQPVCSPTRSQLLTGRYQIHTGLQHSIIWMSTPLCLPSDEVIIAQKLKEAGYSTHLIGKWHVGHYMSHCLPHKRGFDSFFGFYQAGSDYYFHNSTNGVYTGWDLRRDDLLVADEYFGKYSTTMYTQEAIDLISKHDRDKPMFLLFSHQAVHVPLQVPASYSNAYLDLIEDPKRRVYAGMVSSLDLSVDDVVCALKSAGMWDNTVLIFSSDNGGSTAEGGNNWPLRGGKASLHEGGIRAVSFVNSPLLPINVKGSINKELIHVTDWFPTLVHLAKGNFNGVKPLDGINQWQTISEGKPSPRYEILHNIDPLSFRPRARGDEWLGNPYFDITTQAAIRIGDWKLLTGKPGNGKWIPPPESGMEIIENTSLRDELVQLYNIRHDPSEMTDLARSRPDIVSQLLYRLSLYNATAVPCSFPKEDVRGSNPSMGDGGWGPWL
ncbi:arylsulfatase B-like [Ptychodera flava]|uniref:arylsulfatase B-like n=1 Tax=Ptychodera flava TaxID=63121 RepID=UPI00396A2A81